MSESEIPPTPEGLGDGGAKLWASIVDDFEMSQHELTLLAQCCCTLDACEQLQAVIDADGVLSEKGTGARIHPAVVELRAQRLTLTKLLAALQLPAGVESGKVRARREHWPLSAV
jgi:hypothetical protein